MMRSLYEDIKILFVWTLGHLDSDTGDATGLKTKQFLPFNHLYHNPLNPG